MAHKYFHNGLITVGLGNGKVSSDILIFNLPAVSTCPNCEGCKSSCYAMKAERIYPSVRESRKANLMASHCRTFVARMVELIVRSKASTVRIHESGDFYSQEYADKWTQIIAALPHVKFYGYSKSPYRPVGHNLNIVESLLPDGSINFGPKANILAAAKALRAKVCPYKLTKKEIICGKHCKACLVHQRVLFVKH